MCRGNSRGLYLFGSYGPTGSLKFFESFPHTCLRTSSSLGFGALDNIKPHPAWPAISISRWLMISQVITLPPTNEEQIKE
jgi:hypothetical protein